MARPGLIVAVRPRTTISLPGLARTPRRETEVKFPGFQHLGKGRDLPWNRGSNYQVIDLDLLGEHL